MQLWYSGMSPNISKPILPPTADTAATPTWDHWHKFMADIVRHLEDRYSVDEVRNNWYFEVWNEATWMYGPGDGGYNELYYNTALGLMQGDPLVKIGGPADSGGNSLYAIPSLIDFAKATATSSSTSSATTATAQDSTVEDDRGSGRFRQTWKNTLCDDRSPARASPASSSTTSGAPATIPSCRATRRRRPASSPSRFTSSAPTRRRRLPTMYGYWTLSDIYEEMNTGTATAYREGNYGLLLKGDPNIPASFDVAKPAFNAFRLLHMMTDTIVPVSGGISGATDNGVGAVATLAGDGNSMQILVYNHINSFDIATWERSRRIDAGVAGGRQPAVHADARPPLPGRPRALELAHDVGRRWASR